MKRSSFLARHGALAVVVLLITACATQGPPVRSDYDRSADFSAYKTFGFPASTGTDRGGYTTLVSSHFKEAVKREMTARGYVFAENSPDLLVNFYSETRDKTRVYSHPGWATTGVWGFNYGRPRYGFYSAWPFYYDRDYDVVQYTSGKIRLDVVDATHKQVLWEASVEEPLTDQAQDNPQPNISRLVAELFRKFPRTIATTSGG